MDPEPGNGDDMNHPRNNFDENPVRRARPTAQFRWNTPHPVDGAWTPRAAAFTPGELSDKP